METKRKFKNALMVSGIVVVFILIIIGIISSTTAKPSTREQVWDEAMTMGDLDAENHYIIYSDLVCPYCVAFENTLVENEEEFEQYFADNDILLEVRLSDYLYEYGDSAPIHSRYSAEATYCAKNEGKFWDYYNKAVTSVWNDFFVEEGKSGASSMSSLGKEYWIDLGKSVGLGDEFANCVENDESLEEVESVAERMAKLQISMPYFVFNKFTQGGYNLIDSYDYVKLLLDEGLKAEYK